MSKPSYKLAEIFKFAVKISYDAGEIIKKERASSSLAISYKDHHEMVTSADLKSNQYICQEILKKYPNHQILSEEEDSATTNYKGPLWILDPIDGTVNYAHNQLHVAISLAFAIDGIVQVGVVHCPFYNETFTAQLKQGAFLNDLPIKVSGQKKLINCLLATGFPYDRTKAEIMVRRLHKMLMSCQGIRRQGSAAIDICWIAMGRLDGYYETLSSWDMAAASLIAREAGAKYGHLNAKPQEIPEDLYSEHIVFSTPEIHSELMEILQNA